MHFLRQRSSIQISFYRARSTDQNTEKRVKSPITHAASIIFPHAACRPTLGVVTEECCFKIRYSVHQGVLPESLLVQWDLKLCAYNCSCHGNRHKQPMGTTCVSIHEAGKATLSPIHERGNECVLIRFRLIPVATSWVACLDSVAKGHWLTGCPRRQNQRQMDGFCE